MSLSRRGPRGGAESHSDLYQGMNIDPEFRNASAWSLGQWYEVCFELNERQLPIALNTIWRHPRLQGPWQRPEELTEQASRLLEVPRPQPGVYLYGLLRLSHEIWLACETVPVGVRDGCDLCLALPVTLLRRPLAVHEPIHESSNPWRKLVDQVLVEVADAVFASTRFDFASLGEEAGCVSPNSKTVIAEDLERGGLLLSPELRTSVRSGAKGIALPSGLLWFPERYA